MDPFQIVLVGCGGMANTWVEYALSRDDTKIVGLVDLNLDTAKAMAQRYHLSCPVFANVKGAIESTGANLVFDVTVPEAHKDITISALNMGCNILGEKPLATSMKEAKEMVQTAHQSGKTYAIMQNRRYLRHIRAYRELISSGTIGEQGFLCADFFLAPHFGGFRDMMESPLILDMAIHTFDQARFISGADPISVYCHEFNTPGSWYQGNASAVCIFEMSNNSVFCYRGSWSAEGAATSWESSWRLVGSMGTAIWDGNNLPYAEVPKVGNEKKFTNDFCRVDSELTWSGREGHDGCLDEMFEALLNNRKAETDCSDNIKSMSMVFGAIRSAKTGRKVFISEI